MTSSDRQTSVASVLVYKLPLQSVMFGLSLGIATQVLDLDLALPDLVPCDLVNIPGLQQQCLTYLVQI